MIRKNLKTYLAFTVSCLIFSNMLYALPDKIEFWFLSSAAKVSYFNNLLTPKFIFSKKIVFNYGGESKGWRKMGDQYFHPQFGIQDNPGHAEDFEKKKKGPDDFFKDAAKTKAKQANFLSNREVNLIECDKGNYFDLYCGKAKGEKGSPVTKTPVEIWVDISSSLREIDSNYKKDGCNRLSFIKRIREKCNKEQVDVYTFDTSKKQLGSLDALCINHGLNDQKRLMRWVKNSNAKKLIVITDISELTKQLSDFLYSVGGKSVGDRPGSEFTADMLLGKVDEVAKSCKKK